MPEYANDMGGMMTDAEESAPSADAPEEYSSESEPTAELPKTVLGGKEFKPGEEVVLKIVEVRDNSVLVAYATEDEESGEGGPPEGGEGYGGPPESPAAGGEMSGLME